MEKIGQMAQFSTTNAYILPINFITFRKKEKKSERRNEQNSSNFHKSEYF